MKAHTARERSKNRHMEQRSRAGAEVPFDREALERSAFRNPTDKLFEIHGSAGDAFFA